MDHSESAKTRAAGFAFGFIAIVTLIFAIWSFIDESNFNRVGKRTMGTVIESQMRRTQHRIGEEPKWRNHLLVAYLNRQDWFTVPGDVARDYKKGEPVEVIYSENQTKFSAELVPAVGRAKFYFLAVSIAATGASIGMLVWAKRMRREEEDPDAPSLEEALRQAR